MAGASALFSNKLTDFSPWNQDNSDVFSGQIALFLDDSLLTSYHHSGSFAMDSLLLKYCRSPEHRVVVIHSSQSSGHYQSILMKNLLDVATLHNAGSFNCCRLVSSFFESIELSPLRELLPWTTANMSVTQGKSSNNNSGNASWAKDMTWSELLQWQQQQLASPSPESSHLKTVVFIDDLDAFELLAPSPADARYFLQQFARALIRAAPSACIDSLIAFGRLRDHEETNHAQETSNSTTSNNMNSNYQLKMSASLHIDQQQPLLTTFLLARAQWIIVASALRTGLSSIVHGTLSITQQDVCTEKAPSRKRQILQYRALDSGVQCVASD